MFQIAATYGYALDNIVKPVFDFNRAMKVHEDINIYRSNILRNIEIGKGFADVLYQEPSFKYTRIPTLVKGDIYLDGYFQSEKYFIKHHEKIRELFNEHEDIKKWMSQTNNLMYHDEDRDELRIAIPSDIYKMLYVLKLVELLFNY